ncbi:hypothetical protein K493DRAFT_312641 [Basidiobolus meristosporus CBS 931.73]|uniref:Cyclin N-terminal domain-containing protein n=1 Tax=Basidiobolus meristosporus CBS 931.73 TaxID=1314790 RepID=A0A1Y1YSD2_9FUNG|nr:hypothetical protein K493DRAFT_312641 [Basidiobolus meristosporus CBS 931.73]|eukprot:ORY00932.1 hypothetical protein K493DRAFT_312641 [Basidiobolus meristosporus CBS 931.73]
MKLNQVNEAIPPRQFILEIVRRSGVPIGIWSLALLYLLKLQTKEPCFENPSCMDFARCGRRMFVASLMVTSKFTQDKNYKNRTWANIMGVSVAEVNCIEYTFLKLMDHDLIIPEKIYHHWERFLQKQIFLREPHMGPLTTKQYQKPNSPLRFAPYIIQRFSARCKQGRNTHVKSPMVVTGQENKLTRSYLPCSPPKEAPISSGIPNVTGTPYPCVGISGYLTP